MFCVESWHPEYLIVSSEAPSLLYYTHIPAALAALLLGFFVFSKSKSLIGRILLAISLVFSVWSFSNLVVWVNDASYIISFFWATFPLLTALIAILTFYFMYVFLFEKDLSLLNKIVIFIPLLPIIITTPTIFNIESFDVINCEAINNIYLVTYYYVIGSFAMLGILSLLILSWWKKTKIARREAIFMTIGLELFLLLFLSLGYIASYVGYYQIEYYGLLGMVVFLAFLSFIIVRFKAFDIKLIGAQALVWALIILISSQYFFVQTLTNKILVSVTLVLSAVVGLMIIRSVKKEVAQREELAVANESQQLLIRFITHQVKGFFTKSKMVFASLLEGDFGEVPESVRGVLKDGLESDNKAVEMVQEVLKASSLRSGTMTYNFEETDIVSFVREIAESFKDAAKDKNLEYLFDLPAEVVNMKIDKLQMTQVIKNLIDNSIKYTPNGFVKVEMHKYLDKIIFDVRDSGFGLTDADKAKLFREGGRGEESLKLNVNSTGYGLYIVKKIVEGHGGRIWAESAGRGKGSKFCVELPLVKI